MTPLKVLYIEDSAEDMLLLEKACRESGLNTEFFVLNDGQKGIHFIDLMSPETSVLPDVIIVDYALPYKNGLDVISAIRKKDFLKNIPIILFTGRETDEIIYNCHLLGAIYMPKPHLHRKYSEITDILSGMTIHKKWNRLNTQHLKMVLDA